MPLSFFVKKNDTVIVNVFVYTADNKVQATTDKKSVPNEAEPTSVVFTFRKPNYKDSSRVMGLMQMKAQDNSADINIAALHDDIFYNLLSDWDIKDESGNSVPCSMANRQSMEPAIVQAAIAGYLMHVQF